MNLVFLGPPGAGKGTHARVIAQMYGLPHISTGDLLRAKINGDTPVGRQAKSYVESGQLVPDAVVIEMMRQRLSEPDAAKGFILDGFPRTVAQAEALDQVLSKLGKKLDRIVNFKTSTEVVIQRLSGRLICPKCGANYHVTNIPPRKAGFCDADGEALIQRADDQEKTVRSRLAVYEKETKPLIEYYTKRKLLQNVDADQSVEAVQKALRALF